MELDTAAPPVGQDGHPTADGGIWLNGDILACACPDCGAPMSIRLWLMVADCFRCGASIELSDEQEQEALRLLRRQEVAKQAESQAAAAAISPTMARHPPPMPTSPPAETLRQPRRVAASQVHRGTRAHIRKLYERGGALVFFTSLLSDLPAWLVSLIVHMIALLLLGLWFDKPPEEDLSITLSTSLSYQDLQGQKSELDPVLPDAFEFEDPGAIELISDVQARGTPAEQVDLQPMDPPIAVPQLVGRVPDSAARAATRMPTGQVGRMFVGRDPQTRARMVKEDGGTTFTEAAVTRGLEFLARHQRVDGSWSLHRFNAHPGCDKTCTGPGRMHNDTAATALALLPFLGAGQTHWEGDYTGQVTAGLRWLIEHQKPDGDLRGGGPRISQMYAHAQAAIALCEAYALTGDDQLREPAQLAVNFIVYAQHPKGGWRYSPGEPADTSVVGWQLMALKSAQMAYLLVPREAFQLSGQYLDRAQTDSSGGRYGYQPGHRPTPSMTAEALLCRQYLGWGQDHPGLVSGANFLERKHPPSTKQTNIYYWYYATQMMHHHGGRPWRKWNARMRNVLVDTQEQHGHAAGSWTPRGHGGSGGHAQSGGRIYMTALAICTLEVYYRHMPLYSQDAVEGVE